MLFVPVRARKRPRLRREAYRSVRRARTV